MADRRMIVSNIFEDEWFGMLDMTSKVIWIGLITTVADDQGRFPFNVSLIRSKLFVYQDISLDEIDQIVRGMIEDKKLILYIDGRPYLQIAAWWKNQNPSWAMPSKYPAPPNWIDRARYHVTPKDINEINWKLSGGYPNGDGSLLLSELPNELPNTLPNELPMLQVKLRQEEVKIRQEQDELSAASLPPVAVSLSEFHDHTARDAERLYQGITGQPTIPPAQYDSAIPLLIGILESYNGDKPNCLHDGQAYFTKWCNTTGKSGKRYAVTNTNWLTWWYEARAPRPVAQSQSIEHPTNAYCQNGASLKKQAENAMPDEKQELTRLYRDHIKSCHICGGGAGPERANMPEAVKAELDKLLKHKAVKT